MTYRRMVWAEGMLMSPHHLQQQDEFHAALIEGRVRSVEPYSWGVLEVALDRTALNAGQVSIETFSGVLPGGLTLELGAGQGLMPPSRSIEEHFPHSRTSVDVYLGVPRHRENARAFGPSGDPDARFLLRSRSVRDIVGGGDAREIEHADPNVVLLFGGESLDDYEILKIAEVVRGAAGSFAVVDPFIPSCLRIGASPFLMASLRRVLAAVTSRRKALMDAQRERGDALEYNGADVTRYLLLSALNTHTPVLEHMVEAQDLHPRATYLLLAQFAGQLTSFASTHDPSALPKFRFDDLRGTFEALFAAIASMLHTAIQDQYVALPLVSLGNGMYEARVEGDRFPRRGRFFLAVRSPLRSEEVAQQLPRLSKIASGTEVGQIVAAASPGAPVEVTFRPPPEIPLKSGITYFAINTNNGYWEGAIRERHVVVFLPMPFTPTETHLEILAISGGGSS